jgi:hypothetical protein
MYRCKIVYIKLLSFYQKDTMGLYASRPYPGYDPLRPPRPPISGSSGLQALFRAEALDNYRQQVDASNLNRISRKDQAYLPSVHSIQKDVPDADMNEPWPNGQVVWMESTADSGLPHTRPPNLICLPRTIGDAEFQKTLLHERVHISQRLHPDAWKKIFAETWDFQQWSGNLPADIQQRRRLNPDTLLFPFFIWRGKYVPVELFNSTSMPTLSDTSTIWWDTTTRTVHREPPPGWTEFFGAHANGGEHPFELIAYMVAENKVNSPAYRAIQPRLKGLPTIEV